jgi:hypothetical protein
VGPLKRVGQNGKGTSIPFCFTVGVIEECGDIDESGVIEKKTG